MTDPIIVQRNVGGSKKWNPYYKFGPSRVAEVVDDITVSLTDLLGKQELVTERVTVR